MLSSRQGCDLSKITNPNVPSHKILGAHHFSLYEKSKVFSDAWRQKVVAYDTLAFFKAQPVKAHKMFGLQSK